MHIAALEGRLKAIEIVGSNFPHDVVTLNTNGRTPLQALRAELRRQRGLLRPRSDGSSKDYMRFFTALSGVRIIDLSEVPTSVVDGVMAPSPGEGGSLFNHSAVVETLRANYGCMRGLCIGGFVSPRVCLASVSACAGIPKHLKPEGPCIERYSWEEAFSITRPWSDDYRWKEDFQDPYFFDCLADCVRNGRAPAWKNVDHYCHSLDPGLKPDSR